jgi:hypothetical protein
MRPHSRREVEMKRFAIAVLVASAGLSAVLVPVDVRSEVSVNINIGPPAIVVAEPPEMIPIPRSMVYFAPGVSVDLFFFEGYWWTRNDGRWFRSRGYRGPWKVIGPRGVPVEIVRVPHDYRTVYIREHRVPHGHLKRHWEHRVHERRERRGEWKDWKEEKRERKAERREERRERKEHRKDSREERQERGERGHGRGDRGPDR